jgi:hypothetical protein
MISLESNDDSMRSSFSVSDRKRSVSFAETASVHIIENLQHMSNDELRNTWYRKSEFDEIKKRMIPLIKAMMRGEPTAESDEVTFRGLEYRTRQGALRRQHNKVNSYTSVLDEQDRQRHAGVLDIDAIRNVYIQNSAHCLVSARQLGVEDEEVIRGFMDVEPYEAHIEDCSPSDSEDSFSVSSHSQQKLRGLNKLVKRFRRKQHWLYDDLTGLVLPPHVHDLPQAA